MGMGWLGGIVIFEKCDVVIFLIKDKIKVCG